mgnify:CR=1 FL=1
MLWMSHEVYLETIQLFNNTQALKGEGGCFAELYNELGAAAGKLQILESFLAPEEYDRRVSELRSIAADLPEHHDVEVLDQARGRIAEVVVYEQPTVVS